MPIVFNIPNSDLETQVTKTKLQTIDTDNPSFNTLNELIELDMENNLDNNNLHNQENSQDNINQINIPKIIRNTKTYKYKLGKSKKTNNIGIFIKNRNTLKNIKKDFKKLRDIDINEVKHYLRNHNIIKAGTNAPNDVLRELYEKMILAGDITNNNTGNLIYNYINE